VKPGAIEKVKHVIAAQKWLMFPLILFALSIALQARGTYETLNGWIVDFRMERVQVPASGEIAVIAIDPDSLKDIGTWPWPRSIHAEILDRLIDLGAGVVFFDVDFAFPSSAAGDQAFADALERAGGATLLATFAQRGLDGNILYNQPHTPFYQRSWPAVVTVTPNDNGHIRQYPTGALIDGQFVPSAGVQLAGSYADNTQGFTVNFGISPDAIPVFSAIDLLNGKLIGSEIAGRSILIGAAAAELGDHFAVPLHKVVPGVMIHAIAAETLLQDVAISQLPAVWLLPPMFILLCSLHFVGRHNAWRLVSLAFLSSIGVEFVAILSFASSFTSWPTAMIHPALIILAIGRLAKSVDLSRILLRRQEVEMENSERLRRHIFQNSSDGFLAINRNGDIVFQSDVAKSLLGSGALPNDVLSTAMRVMDQAGVNPRLDHLEVKNPAGTTSLELHTNASEIQSLDSRLNLVSEPLALITLRDVTDLKQKQRQIEYLSRHDDRTSALRRHSFCEAIEYRKERDRNFAVVAIALRRLTAINATFGRDIGDQVMAEAVRRLLDESMGLGEVARLEGNVLGVVVPKMASDRSAQREWHRIRNVLIQPYLLAGSQIQIGLSIGYLISDPAQDWDGEAHLSRAQDALAKSIETSNNTPIAYDSADSERRDRSRRLEHALNQALEREEFHLLYQPQYCLSEQSLIGAEALIRWESAEFGNVSPFEFIPIAESSGFITELGQFVLECSIESAAALPAHLTMSPNVSVFQLLSADFPTQVATLLRRHGLSPDRLCLELTESEFLSPNSEAVQRMHDLRSLGVSWALDDFGTGYSSLSYLKELPFDKIKLDRSFLKDVLDDQKAQIALRSIVQLVQGYGKTLLCEGAETKKEIDLLSQFGCDSVQGYYFGRPEPFDELERRAISGIGIVNWNNRIEKIG
jgi:diguanylate cyclase (GGDEF)-like protein